MQQRRRGALRLAGYDYATPGAYFLTICTHGRQCWLVDPVLCALVETTWQSLPARST